MNKGMISAQFLREFAVRENKIFVINCYKNIKRLF